MNRKKITTASHGEPGDPEAFFSDAFSGGAEPLHFDLNVVVGDLIAPDQLAGLVMCWPSGISMTLAERSCVQRSLSQQRRARAVAREHVVACLLAPGRDLRVFYRPWPVGMIGKGRPSTSGRPIFVCASFRASQMSVATLTDDRVRMQIMAL